LIIEIVYSRVKFFFAALLLTVLQSAVHAQTITYETVYVDYDSAVEFKNLKIIPVRPKSGAGHSNGGILSLGRALEKGLATISERGTASTENVHYLRIRNNSDQAIYVASGEIISGGRQDRMVTRDSLLLPNGKDQYISVMCVEEGRWSDKEKKFGYGNFANPALRKVLDENKNQVLIWQEISRQLEGNHIKNNSLGYLSRYADKKMKPFQDEYFNFFHDRFKLMDSTIVGFVCLSGDKVIGSDIFADRDLFYYLLDPLLKGYCDEAFFMGKPVTIVNEEVKRYMDKVLRDEKTQADFLKDNGKIFRQNGQVIHINSY
jgi:hypothetical protein